MKHRQQHPRALRTRLIDGDDGRRLQGNNKNNKDDAKTAPPIFAPTMSPTTPPKVTDRLFQGSLSLEWSLLLLTKVDAEGLSQPNVFDATASATNNGVNELKNWIAQDFLCLQDTIWLTSDMKNLDSDCQATLRRRTQETQPPTVTADQPLYPYRTILWNDPVVLESREILNGTNTEYTVWSMEYPVYSYAIERSHEEETVEERLQGLLNQRIEKRIIEWEDGILAVVGNETEIFASTDHFWHTNNDPLILIELGPISLTPLEAIGAGIVLMQTIVLIVLHVFIKPCLNHRIGERKLEKEELVVYLPVKPHGSHPHTSQSRTSRAQYYTGPGFIPSNIAVPDRTKRSSGSSSAYPIPY